MIIYREIDRYKYQTRADYTCETGIKVPETIVSSGGYIRLNGPGCLWIKSGYAWDGASGPTWDSKNTLEPSLVHDCGYQLIREGLVDMSCRDRFDRLLQKQLLENGVWQVRAWYYYHGVRLGGASAAKPRPVPVDLQAP